MAATGGPHYPPRNKGGIWGGSLGDRRSLSILGLSVGSSPSDIRLAYLDLIRLHHPDRSVLGVETGLAASINRAYYDLAHRDRPRQVEVVVVPQLRRTSSLATRLLWGLLFASAVIGLVVVAGMLESPRARHIAYTAPVSDGDQLKSEIARQAALDLDWLTLESGVDGAERFSKRCYGDAGPDSKDLLFCGSVDARSAQLFSGQRDYFDIGERQGRFFSAARRFSIDPLRTWNELEQQAYLTRESELSATTSIIPHPSLTLPVGRLADKVEVSDP